MKAQSTDNGAGSGQLKDMPGTYPHFSLAILLLYGMNTGLSKFTQTAGIQFPSALIGKQSCLTTIEDITCCALDNCYASRVMSQPSCHNLFIAGKTSLPTQHLVVEQNKYCGGRSIWPTMKTRGRKTVHVLLHIWPGASMVQAHLA